MNYAVSNSQDDEGNDTFTIVTQTDFSDLDEVWEFLRENVSSGDTIAWQLDPAEDNN
jgi:hypothetical protein